MPDNQIENLSTRFRKIRAFYGKKQQEFADMAGILQSQVSQVETNENNITPTIKLALVQNLKVNLVWLETGVGEMFSTNEESNTHEADNIGSINADEESPKSKFSRHKHSYVKGERLIPVYPDSVTAGEIEVYNDIPTTEPAFYVNIPQFKDCKFGKSVFGHSMYPTITSGAYIFCKEVDEKTRYVPGEIYYIEYDNFGVCKRVQHGPTPGEVLLVSDNDELRNDGTRRYESYVIKIDDIREIFLVKGFFNQNHN